MLVKWPRRTVRAPKTMNAPSPSSTTKPITPETTAGRSPAAPTRISAASWMPATTHTVISAIQTTNHSTPTAAWSRPPTERLAPRSGCGSGRSRIARTMLRFATRNEENATVMNVSTTPRL